MLNKQFITNIVEDFLTDSSVFLVDVSIKPGNCIVVEIDSESGLGIDDCVNLSKNIESKLDREEEDFELEVGSSGVTSPFKILRQYQKNIGNEVEVLTRTGQKIVGILKECDDAEFVVVVTKMEKPEGSKRKVEVEEDLRFAYNDVKYTKYLIRFK